MPAKRDQKDVEFPDDEDFAVRGVVKAYAYDAARRAALGSFTGWKPTVAAAEERLRRWWREQVAAMYRSGELHWLASPKAAQFARNCPPAGVLTDVKARSCRRPVVCPYCRARLAASAYKRLAAVAFPTRRRPAGCDVLGVMRIRRRAAFRDRGESEDPHFTIDPHAWRDALVVASSQLRSIDVSPFAASPFLAGGVLYVRVRLEPRAIATDAHLVFVGDGEAGFVAAAKGASACPSQRGATFSYFTKADVTRKRLVRLVGNAFAFPHDTFRRLRDGRLSYAHLGELQDMTARRRLFRTYGGCFNKPL